MLIRKHLLGQLVIQSACIQTCNSNFKTIFNLLTDRLPDWLGPCLNPASDPTADPEPGAEAWLYPLSGYQNRSWQRQRFLSDFGTNLSIIITIKCNICDDSQRRTENLRCCG